MVTKRIQIRKIIDTGPSGPGTKARKVVVVKKIGDATEKDIRWVEAEGGEVEICCVCDDACSCAGGVCSCGCCEVEFVGSTIPTMTEVDEDGEQVITIRIPRVETATGEADPLVHAAGVSDAIDGLAGQVAELVRGARAQGYSWTRIGDALGISRQAAWERFSGEE